MDLKTTTLDPLINLTRKENGNKDLESFAHHVAAGLSQPPKKLSSRYFYDGPGSALFQQIMELPEYYPTRCEYEVLTDNKAAITAHLAKKGFFHLIDLGAGDALKTKILLKELQERQILFDYLPVDISEDAMQQLSSSLEKEMPELNHQAIVGDYDDSLGWLQHNKTGRKVILFLGSNIGNFEHEESLDFLSKVRSHLEPGDSLLLGIDLRKDPDKILSAYNDSAGVTAAFNLNLLHRINRELGGDFDVNGFFHYPIYNPQEGVMRSYLVSKQEQNVFIQATGKSFHFSAWEAIHTESSYKYTLPQIQAMAEASGFIMEIVFQDNQGCFADVIFKAV
ncbi:L-histidine N(alpha)-methyltransferase [Pontibacter sp. FD36]|uniref:L-histidine N(alpha)-methyltransferase n=1 Tax=Pontibacter sp. FD36 TaxID=2789860 RepID=UPI0018ABF925|nr:L-histidine N(alpha)-methyltransferase [Pontibacter sp. FD36]MBF8965477.1 L-histidine N(alpha)-methyltransferase [Pontibacter sp. FD36]